MSRALPAALLDLDVVVVGSGAGGLTAALRAAGHGLRVAVLEKDDVAGGTAALTGGGLWAPTNAALREAGVDDDLERAQSYLSSTVGDRTSRSMQQAFLRAAAPTLDWLAGEGIGFAWLTRFPDYHPGEPGGLLTGRAVSPTPVGRADAESLQVPLRAALACGDGGPTSRAYDTKGRLHGGRALVGGLLLGCQRAGVPVLTGTPFVDLVADGDRVTGVRARVDGSEVDVPARLGAVLAAGGFEHGEPMRRRWQDDAVASGRWSLGVAGNTGDGIAAGLRLGAATDLMDDSWWTPGFVRPDGGVSFLLWERIAPLGFVVDQRGERWVNEALPYNAFGHAMRRHEGALPSWQVLDARGLDRYGFGGLAAGEDPTPWVEAGALHRAETLAGLADRLAAPRLVETGARWDALVADGVDHDFGRGAEGSYERQLLQVFQAYPGVVGPEDLPNPCLGPVREGPYYAAPVVLADLGTKGGLVCDERARVTRPDGSVIAGLYACGNTMASVMGHAYPGPGACITPGMAFGRLAADHLAGRG